ncbi:MAG: STAS domain-containing protein [Clostridiales bacterium]|nr:STAS domain-containing protein [Clostridiales bacterium]
MKMSGKFRDGELTLILAGELDHHAAKEIMAKLGGKLDAYMPRDCVLDLSGLQFMDSSGIALILRTYRKMNELEGRLRVTNVPPQPMKVLDAAGIERLIEIKEMGQ